MWQVLCKSKCLICTPSGIDNWLHQGHQRFLSAKRERVSLVGPEWRSLQLLWLASASVLPRVWRWFLLPRYCWLECGPSFLLEMIYCRFGYRLPKELANFQVFPKRRFSRHSSSSLVYFLVLVGALKPPLGGCDEPLLEPEPDPLPEPLFAEPELPPDPLFFEPDPLPDPLPDLLLLPDPLPLALAAAISKAP